MTIGEGNSDTDISSIRAASAKETPSLTSLSRFGVSMYGYPSALIVS